MKMAMLQMLPLWQVFAVVVDEYEDVEHDDVV